MDKIKANVGLIQIIRVCFSLIFSVSVLSVFWKENGLDIEDIFVLQGIFALSIVFFEIPTGYIGDRLGRKKTIMLASLVVIFGWVAYFFSREFWALVICEIILGIGFSFFSGTDSAFLFETLKELKQDKDFTVIEGRQQGLKHWAEGGSSLIGGVLAFWLPIPFLFLLSAVSIGVAFICCFRLTEPHRESYSHSRGVLYGFYKIGRFVFFKSKIVRFALPLFAVCSFSTMIGVWFFQSFWEELSYPLWSFGILWAAIALPTSFASHFADKIEKKLGAKWALLILPLPVLVGYLGAALVPGMIAAIFIYFTSLLRGYCWPILTRYINEETFSDKRATVLSIMSWLFRFSYFLIAPLVGKIGRLRGIRTGFLACGGISLLLFLIFLPGMVRMIHNRNTNDEVV